MRWRVGLAVLLLAPLALLAFGTWIAVGIGLFGAARTAMALDNSDLQAAAAGAETAARGASVLESTWTSAPARLISPLTFGLVNNVGTATQALSGLAGMAPGALRTVDLVNDDDQEPILDGGTVNLDRVPAFAEPMADIAESMDQAVPALQQLPDAGPIGRMLAERAQPLTDQLTEWQPVVDGLAAGIPSLPEALGQDGTKRYLLCALNDAELFGSGGAPLHAFMLAVKDGKVSVEESGHLGTELADDAPPIAWEHAGQLPWYVEGKYYPFVNSNFHPDFRTASVDMSRAWAALGFPYVDGVITVDVKALSMLLAEIGPIKAEGYGTLTSENIIAKLLVEAYRGIPGTREGQALRRAQNAALAAALVGEVGKPGNSRPALRGLLAAIPGRHLQLAFADAGMESAADAMRATGRLSDGPGDLIGVFTQNSPNKNSIFHVRSISQDVQLTADGGARVTRQVRFTNAVPANVEGEPDKYRGYTALRARFRVAHRAPLGVEGLAMTTDDLRTFGQTPVGPYDDQRGGQVLWKGHRLKIGETVTDTVTYQLPAGTFEPGHYEVWADPQAVTLPATMQLRVTPTAGESLDAPNGWSAEGSTLVWSGDLNRPIHLTVG